MVQAAGADLHDDFIGRGLGIGQGAEFENSGLAVSDKLERFHAARLRQGCRAGKWFVAAAADY